MILGYPIGISSYPIKPVLNQSDSVCDKVNAILGNYYILY